VAAVQLSSPCRGGVRCLWHVVSPWLLAPLPSSYAYGVSTPNPRAAATAMLLPAPPPFHPYSYQRVEGTLLCSDAEGSKNIMVVALRPHLLPWGARWGTPGYGGPHHPAIWYCPHSICQYLAWPRHHHPPVLEKAHLAQPLVCCTSRLWILCHGASAHAVLVWGHQTCPTPTDKHFDPKAKGCPTPIPGSWIPSRTGRWNLRCCQRRRHRRGLGQRQRVPTLAPEAVREGSLFMPAAQRAHRKLWQLQSTVLGQRVQHLPSKLPQQ
jgi:hypothetical protein